MKKLYLSAVFLLSLSMAFAAPVIYVTGNGGNWLNTSTCDLSRHQFDGKAIALTSYKTVVFDSYWKSDLSKLSIKISGMPQCGCVNNMRNSAGATQEIQLNLLLIDSFHAVG